MAARHAARIALARSASERSCQLGASVNFGHRREAVMSEVYRPVGDGATHGELGTAAVDQLGVVTLGSTLVWKSSMVFINLACGMKPL